MVERRKGIILHNILQTLTSATFLLLASLLIYDRWDNNNNTASIEVLKKQLQDQNLKNVYYLEARQNTISSRQDDYQINVNRRIDVLENRMDSLDARKRDNSRIVNNNSAIANGSPVSEQQ